MPEPISNETLLVHITSLRELVMDLKDRDIKDIRDQLNTMNGRQRELTGRISGNAGNIRALRYRMSLAEDSLKTSINLRTAFVGALSTVQALAAYLFSK